MKILFITGSLNQGGAEYQILELAKLFKNKGHEIEVFAITNYDFYLPFIKKNEITYNHLFNEQSKIKRIFLTSKKIKNYKPDLIISYLRSVSQVALFGKILSTFKSRLIIGERTSLVLPKYDRYYFNLMRLADGITVNSISKLNYLRANFPKNKIAFYPNIIDIEKFNFIKKEYNNDKYNIGFIGRISPEKNVLTLIEAVKLLNDRNISLKLSIYGDSRNKKYLNDIESFINKNNLKNIISINGKSTDIKSIYKGIDLLCLISDYEGFSNVLSESLSSGLPVITSNIEENVYLIEDKKNGFIVDHKNSLSIAKGILEYLNLSVEMKTKMAYDNRKKAERIFDKDLIYEKYLKFINDSL